MKLKQKLSIVITAMFIVGFAFFVYAEQPFDKSVFNDSDQDGLSDEEEKMYGTDPFNRDSDGDSYSDGAEIKSGFDPIKPAPGDRVVSLSNNKEENTLDGVAHSLDDFDSKLASFIGQKGEADFSLDELKGFVEESVSGDVAMIEKNSTLTEEELAGIKIKNQDYEKLSEEEGKKMMKDDAIEYLAQVLEILVANYPGTIDDHHDLETAYRNFTEELEKLNSDSPNYVYFRKMGEKLALANEQIKTVEVPEDFQKLHIGFLTIVKSLLGLREFSLPMEDPMGKMMIISRAMVIADAVSELTDGLVGKIVEYK